MLKEIKNVKQLEGEPRHRWFSDPYVDLFVWHDEDDNIIQFQICYDKGPNEKAFTWNANDGLKHHTVDDGESGVFRMKSSPIFISADKFDTENILTLFSDIGKKLEHDLYDFVYSKLNNNK